MATSRPWTRAAFEGMVIVSSILLAFAVDAWWDGRSELRQERDALELLARDVDGSIAQLREYGRLMDELAGAAFGAYVIIQEGDQISRQDELTALLNRSLFRRTLRLPRAAHSDLVSSGSLRLVRSPDLRNQILSFYESAERSEAIVEKNSAKYVDDAMFALLIESGLFIPRLPPDQMTGLVTERNRRTRERFGGEPPYPQDPLWDLPANAPEWKRLTSSLMMLGQGAEMSGVITDGLLEEALRLQTVLTRYLSAGAL